MEKLNQCVDCVYFDEDEGKCIGNFVPSMFESGKCKIKEKKDDSDRWIPVSERLPKNRVRVIATVIDPNMKAKVVSKEAAYNERLRLWHDGYGNSLIVTAWRTFPEPYKKKELMELMGFETEE